MKDSKFRNKVYLISVDYSQSLDQMAVACNLYCKDGEFSEEIYKKDPKYKNRKVLRQAKLFNSKEELELSVRSEKYLPAAMNDLLSFCLQWYELCRDSIIVASCIMPGKPSKSSSIYLVSGKYLRFDSSFERVPRKFYLAVRDLAR
ncbi:MAG: hypothetical protein ACM3PZ_01115 [Bacillota bacterium]